MKKGEITGVIIAVVVIFMIGFVLGNYTGYFADDEDTDDHSHGLPHSHGTSKADTVEVRNYTSIPSADLVVHTDPKAGWNVQIITKNFTWAPTSASKDHVEGEGHAHIYFDGEKITRLYGEWYYIPELSKGSHEIEVVLSANDHKTYVLDGVEIADAETIIAG